MGNKDLAGTYILQNKDIPLLKFDLMREKIQVGGLEAYDYSLQIKYMNQEKQALLPYSLRQDSSPENLLQWIGKRKAPKNRQFVDKLMQTIGDDENPLAYVAFTGYSEKVSGVVTSPEYTSIGALKKCWSNRLDGIYLIKGDDFIKYTDGRSQATMEYYAVQVAEIMGFEHIPYDLELFHHRNGEKEIVCKCKLFTSEDVGYTAAYDFFRAKGLAMKRANLANIVVQDKMAEIYGREKYGDLMIYDALICNKDRHLGNFGYLTDNNTGAYLRPAPIFDNGFSLLYGAAKNDMENLEEYIYSLSGKYMNFDTAVKLFIRPDHIPGIRKLLNFHFRKHPKYNVANATLEKMSQFIQLRAKKILSLYREKE